MAIITISREMGSAGIPIAHKAAEKLGYTLVDGETIAKVAPQYGLTLEALEKADEKPPAFIETLDERTEVDLRQIELIILDYALKGNVIIYGRGGQDLLKEISSVFRVRVIAPFETRVERWAEREWLDPDLARVLVRKSDQQRAGFIKYYFDREWNDPLGYDLVINTDRLSEETAVKLICDGVKDRNLLDQKGASKKILADLILRARIEISVLSDPEIDGHHVLIDVHEGVVTLGGHIHSEADRRQVFASVQAIKEVRQIRDEMKTLDYRTFPREH
ncbi:MAG: cytidylate kinase family protein [Desulfuromonadales bacterium]|nr:cytidylate kinase family protein [Desulfuromonadales bacterium]